MTLVYDSRHPARDLGAPEQRRWVEDGQAPDRLMAEKRDSAGKVTGTRPLYPFPQVARYDGSGSTDDAANFVSRQPKK
jgi:feruloyl esterase